MAKVYATGKRKSAIAKVWLAPGSGNIIVNGLDLDGWLGGHETIKMKVRQPLVVTRQDANFDIKANNSWWWLFSTSRSFETRNF